jgi:hypothetical protein
MKRLLAFAALATALSAMAWTPPPSPDPREILTSARADRLAGRYEEALQKHLWFHHEALKHQPTLVGVRGSFAIADWATLADKYQPAMLALLKERTDAAAAVVEGRDVRDAFADVAAIDRELDEYRETYRLFLLIESQDEALARRVYRSAREALLEVKDYARVGKYLDPDVELKMVREMVASANRPGRPDIPGLKEMEAQFMRVRAAETVALLVLGGRADDARRLSARFRREFPDPQLDALLARAGEGQLPPPIISPETKALWKKTRP